MSELKGEGFAYFAWHRLHWPHHPECRGINDPFRACGYVWKRRAFFYLVPDAV